MEDYYETFEQVYEEKYEPKYGYLRPIVSKVIYQYLDCGILYNRFARVKCKSCGHEYLLASTIITSQLPVSSWHEVIGDPTIADAICDRIINSLYRIELKGESVRVKYKID